MEQRHKAWRIRGEKFRLSECFTIPEWLELCAKHGHKCLACGNQDALLEPDHVTPLERGGTNTIDNIQPLCGACNRRKGDRYRIDYRISRDVLERYPSRAVHHSPSSVAILNTPELSAKVRALADAEGVAVAKWIRVAIMERLARAGS